MNIECDGKVYNPLGGGSYVFEKDIANFLLQKFTKDNIVVILNTEDPFEVVVTEPVVEEPEDNTINRSFTISRRCRWKLR